MATVCQSRRTDVDHALEWSHGKPREIPRQGFFLRRHMTPTPGQAVGCTGGDRHVASLEHRTNMVESRHAGGIGRRGLVRVSLHHAWWLQLDTCRSTHRRGGGEATRSQRLLRHDPYLVVTVYRVQGLDDVGTGGGEIG